MAKATLIGESLINGLLTVSEINSRSSWREADRYGCGATLPWEGHGFQKGSTRIETWEEVARAGLYLPAPLRQAAS